MVLKASQYQLRTRVTGQDYCCPLTFHIYRENKYSQIINPSPQSQLPDATDANNVKEVPLAVTTDTL